MSESKSGIHWLCELKCSVHLMDRPHFWSFQEKQTCGENLSTTKVFIFSVTGSGFVGSEIEKMPKVGKIFLTWVKNEHVCPLQQFWQKRTQVLHCWWYLSPVLGDHKWEISSLNSCTSLTAGNFPIKTLQFPRLTITQHFFSVRFSLSASTSVFYLVDR